MQVIVKGTMHKVYERVPFVNKETGESSPTAYGLQLIVEVKLSNGSTKDDICDIKISKELMDNYTQKKGQLIEVPCSPYSKTQISLSAVQ